MSVEQRPDKLTPEQYQIPTHAPEHEERVDDFSERNESWFKRYRKALIAAGAVATAGATLAAGLAFGLKGNSGEKNGSSSNEGQRPVATASANPGETNPSTPAAEAGPDSWNADNLPISIDIDGNGTPESFTGKEQLAQALSLEVAKYPTAEEAAKALVERFNTVVSFGTNAEAAAKYDKYLSADKERLGVGAVRQDVVLPAFTEALVGSPEDGAQVMASPDEWTTWVEETAQEVGHRWQTTKEQTPYKYSCTLNTAKTEDGVVFNSGDPASGLEHGTIFIKCLDNLDETDLGSRQLADGTVGYNSLNSKQAWFVDLQQKDGKWKVVGMQTEEMLQ